MKNKSLTKNFIYNVILTVLTIIFPLITYPYVTRVLGADGLGKVNFAISIVSYFALLAALGIPTYGIREIAKCRDDKEKLSKTFSEIFLINSISTAIFTAIYFIMIFSVGYFAQERNLFIVMGLTIVFNLINVDWLFQGFEEYKYITIRSIIFKVLSIIIMFLTVKSEGDYVIYGAIGIIAVSGSSIVNIIHSRKVVKFTLKDLSLKKHFKYILTIFFMSVSINIYTNLDSTMLGFMAGDKQVGYYSNAMKVNRMVISVITSLGAVLLPRLSYYIEKNEMDKFNQITKKSINFVFLVAIPSCVGLFILAPNIIRAFSGTKFIESIPMMMINVPVILFVAIANITSMQILLPFGKERTIATIVTISAVVNLISNLIMIPLFQGRGAAFSSALAEFVGVALQIVACKEYILKPILDKTNAKYLIGSVIVAIISIVSANVFKNDFVVIAVSIIASGLAYLGIMILFKDEVVDLILCKLKLKNV